MPIFSAHTVDPNWTQKLFSSPFYFSVVATFTCSYIIGPFVTRRLVSKEKYQKLRQADIHFLNDWFVTSLYAAGYVVWGSVLFFSDLNQYKIFGISPAAASALQFSVGFMVADTCVKLLNPYLRGMYSTYLHHFMATFAYCCCLYNQGGIYFIISYTLVTELSTAIAYIYVVFRKVGDKKTVWYSIAAATRLISFFLCRIVALPLLQYEGSILAFSPVAVDVPLIWKLLIIIFSTAFYCLNVFWFCKMLRAGYKIIFSSKNE